MAKNETKSIMAAQVKAFNLSEWLDGVVAFESL